MKAVQNDKTLGERFRFKHGGSVKMGFKRFFF